MWSIHCNYLVNKNIVMNWNEIHRYLNVDKLNVVLVICSTSKYIKSKNIVMYLIGTNIPFVVYYLYYHYYDCSFLIIFKILHSHKKITEKNHLQKINCFVMLLFMALWQFTRFNVSQVLKISLTLLYNFLFQ